MKGLHNRTLTDCSGMRVSAFLGCWQTNQTLRVEEISPIHMTIEKEALRFKGKI